MLSNKLSAITMNAPLSHKIHGIHGNGLDHKLSLCAMPFQTTHYRGQTQVVQPARITRTRRTLRLEAT